MFMCFSNYKKSYQDTNSHAEIAIKINNKQRFL